jgi:hypothetical protein
LKLAPENDLRSEYQEPAFVERHFELSAEIHGCSTHPDNAGAQGPRTAMQVHCSAPFRAAGSRCYRTVFSKGQIKTVAERCIQLAIE